MGRVITVAYTSMSDKFPREETEKGIKIYNSMSDDLKKRFHDEFKSECEEWHKSDAYSDKESTGYAICCEIPNECGTSGWVIFLIIFLVLGVLAGGAAAFYFFYWKRKNGGKEEIVEENTESTDIENPKSVIEIPIGTY